MGKKARAAKRDAAWLQREQEDEAAARELLFGSPADGQLPVDGKGFARKLGSSNRRVREKGVKLLEMWLSNKRLSSNTASQTEGVSDDEWKRIWKGLFYCVWHSDKPLVQARVVMAFTAVLGKDCLFSNDYPASIGVRLQVIDIFLDEVEDVLEDSDRLSQDTISRLVMPFLITIRLPGDNRILTRVQEKIVVGLVRRVLYETEPKHKIWTNFNVATLVEYVFEIASDPETPQSNRESLYRTHGKLSQLCKKANVTLKTEDAESEALDEEFNLNGEMTKSGGKDKGSLRKSKRNISKVASGNSDGNLSENPNKRQKVPNAPSTTVRLGEEEGSPPVFSTKKWPSVPTGKKTVKFGLANNEEIAANAPRRNLDYDPQKSPTSSAKGVLKRTSTPIPIKKPSRLVKSKVKQKPPMT